MVWFTSMGFFDNDNTNIPDNQETGGIAAPKMCKEFILYSPHIKIVSLLLCIDMKTCEFDLELMK